MTAVVRRIKMGEAHPDDLPRLINEYAQVLEATAAALREVAAGRLDWAQTLTTDVHARLETLHAALEAGMASSEVVVSVVEGLKVAA
jgi:phage-related minor tail protein